MLAAASRSRPRSGGRRGLGLVLWLGRVEAAETRVVAGRTPSVGSVTPPGSLSRFRPSPVAPAPNHRRRATRSRRRSTCHRGDGCTGVDRSPRRAPGRRRAAPSLIPVAGRSGTPADPGTRRTAPSADRQHPASGAGAHGCTDTAAAPRRIAVRSGGGKHWRLAGAASRVAAETTARLRHRSAAIARRRPRWWCASEGALCWPVRHAVAAVAPLASNSAARTRDRPSAFRCHQQSIAAAELDAQRLAHHSVSSRLLRNRPASSWRGLREAGLRRWHPVSTAKVQSRPVEKSSADAFSPLAYARGQSLSGRNRSARWACGQNGMPATTVAPVAMRPTAASTLSRPSCAQ